MVTYPNIPNIGSLSSLGSFAINPSAVSGATSSISSLVSSGTGVTNILSSQVLNPAAFAGIGSGVAGANTSLENGLVQVLLQAWSLFGNTNGNIQNAMTGYVSADGEIAGNFTNISTATSGTGLLTEPSNSAGEADLAASEESSAVLAEDSGGAAGAGAAAIADAAGADSGVLFGAFTGEDVLGTLAGGAGGVGSSMLADAALPGSGSALGTLTGGAPGGLSGSAAGAAGADSMPSLSRLAGGSSALGESAAGGTRTTEDQLEEGDADPDTMDALDGDPSAVRGSDVTEDDLDDLIESTKGQVGDLQDSVSGADGDDEKALGTRQKAARLAMQLGGLEALQAQLRANRNARLLDVGTDPAGTGRFILAINNPDTADNVATLVPRTQLWLSEASISGRDGTGGCVAAALNLVTAASQAGQGQTTSVVIWAGYSLPFNSVTATIDADPGAAAALSQFQNGLHGPHATVIGEASGSVVIVDAAKLPGGVGAGDVIALGSPGIDADTAASLAGRAGSSAADGGPQVWADTDKPADNGPIRVGSAVPRTDYFDAKSRIMPDMANIIVGNYRSIHYLSKR
jgi:Alpha/beta hydrolase